MDDDTYREKVEWGKSGTFLRLAVCIMCGWRTKKDTASKTGKRIAATEWDKLSLAARNVLIRHGVEQ